MKIGSCEKIPLLKLGQIMVEEKDLSGIRVPVHFLRLKKEYSLLVLVASTQLIESK
jgi:hypothetical protein